MIYTERQFLDDAARMDLTTFIHRTFQTINPAQRYNHNWHVEAIAWHLHQCAVGKIKRLLITLPPRYLKSISASVAFPAWLLGRHPSKRIICASYGEALAAPLSRQCRMVVGSDWFRRIFPRTRISPSKDTEMFFETTRRGYRFATSVGGALTGLGGDLFILDDLCKPDDAFSDVRRSAVNDWFDGTLYSRMDNKSERVIIVVMQRLHEEDLAGHLLQKGGWIHLNLPATAAADQRIQTGPRTFYVRRADEVLHQARRRCTRILRSSAENARKPQTRWRSAVVSNSQATSLKVVFGG